VSIVSYVQMLRPVWRQNKNVVAVFVLFSTSRSNNEVAKVLTCSCIAEVDAVTLLRLT
jgi:hypothetical protein